MEAPSESNEIQIIFGMPANKDGGELTAKQKEQWRPWMGFLAYSKALDKVFVPSQLAGMEVAQAIMACGHDNTPFVPIADDKDPQKTLVVLVPIDWAEEQNPDRADVFVAARENALKVWPKSPQQPQPKETPCPETSKQTKI